MSCHLSLQNGYSASFDTLASVTASTETVDPNIYLQLNAQYWPPIFWWALFNVNDLTVAPEQRFFVQATKIQALENWFSRDRALTCLIPEEQHHLIQEFTFLLETAFGVGYLRMELSPLGMDEGNTLQHWREVLSERDGQWIRLQEAQNTDVLEEFDSLYHDMDLIRQDIRDGKSPNPYTLLGGSHDTLWPNAEQRQSLKPVMPDLIYKLSDQADSNSGASTSFFEHSDRHSIQQSESEQAYPEAINPTQKNSQDRTKFTSWILLALVLAFIAYAFLKM